MTRATRRSVLLTGMAIAVLAGQVAGAIERRPLPAVLLTATDGQQVLSSSLVLSGKWLLVVVRPSCAACETLLKSSVIAGEPALPSRMVVVVAGVSGAEAATYAQRFPELAGSRWFADPDRSASKALKVAATPVVFGLRLDRLEWGLVGLVPDVPSVQSALVSWAGAGR